MPPDKGFIARLRRVIDRAGGEAAVARAVGVTPSAVYGWLAGSVPYRRTMLRLCQRYGINEEWLLDGNGHEEFAMTVRETRPAAGISEELAEMIREFPSVPPAFAASALAKMRELFEEFMNAAETTPAHPPAPVKYEPGPRGKKKN